VSANFASVMVEQAGICEWVKGAKTSVESIDRRRVIVNMGSTSGLVGAENVIQP
jgi:hypothetical protein